MLMHDTKGASKWYSKGHTGYYMKDFIDFDSRIDVIKNFIEANLTDGAKIADIGCGDMSLANLMPGYDWHGFDLDPKKDARIIKQDISETPYNCQPGTYDALVCSEVLEHVFMPHEVIYEFNRILKMNGKLIVTVPNFDNIEFHLLDRSQLLFDLKKFWTVEHIRWFNHENMAELLNARGFKILETQGTAHCFSGIMQYAADQLIKHIEAKYNEKLTVAAAGCILGKMFPWYSPGLSFLCEKVM